MQKLANFQDNFPTKGTSREFRLSPPSPNDLIHCFRLIAQQKGQTGDGEVSSYKFSPQFKNTCIIWATHVSYPQQVGFRDSIKYI